MLTFTEETLLLLGDEEGLFLPIKTFLGKRHWVVNAISVRCTPIMLWSKLVYIVTITIKIPHVLISS